MQASRPAVVDSPSSTTSEPWKLYRLGHLLPTCVPKIRGSHISRPVLSGLHILSWRICNVRAVCWPSPSLPTSRLLGLRRSAAVDIPSSCQKSEITNHKPGRTHGWPSSSPHFFHVTGRGGSPSFLWPAGADEVIVYHPSTASVAGPKCGWASCHSTQRGMSG